MKRKQEDQVGDLFVTETQMLLKLLPCKKSGARLIGWFENGAVTDHRVAARDIASLVKKLKKSSHSVRGLTLMTDRGLDFDLKKSGLSRAVEDAGYKHLN